MTRSRTGHRTRDLTLASYLALQGHQYSLEREGESPRGHPIGVWCFDETEDLVSEVKRYNMGTALVQPDRFMRELTRVRRELYDFLGVRRGG